MGIIIKGAIYKCGDVLLRPHYSGEFYCVDCTEYKTKEEIKADYDKKYAKQFIEEGYCLTHDGVNYYECEYSPYNTEDFELLSDLDEIDFYDEETEF
jgi:uncharacterized Zn finger protein (UPF0148 family)